MNLNPPANFVDMVVKKCEEMQKEMITEVDLMRDQTRGELTGGATQMMSVQKALATQQMRMSKVKEVITHTATAADQKKTQDTMEKCCA